MDFPLRPGETIVYRTRTARGGIFWFWLFFLALLTGFFFAYTAAVALASTDMDWPGFVGVYLFFFAALCILGLGFILRAVRTAAAITDRRVLYRGWLDPRPTQISREAIADTKLRETDTPTPSIRIADTDGATVELRWIDSAHEIHEHLAGGVAITPRPLSDKARALLALGAFGMSAGAVAAVALVGLFLLDPLLTPLLELYGDALTATGFPEKVGDFIMLVVLVITILPPLLALTSIGGFVGSLPVLILTRLVLSADEAKDMARYITRQDSVSFAGAATLHLGVHLPVLDSIFRFWTGGLRPCLLRRAERLLTWLYGEPIPFR